MCSNDPPSHTEAHALKRSVKTRHGTDAVAIAMALMIDKIADAVEPRWASL